MPQDRDEGGSYPAPPLLRRRTVADETDPTSRLMALRDDDVRSAIEDVQRRAGDEQLRARLAMSGFAGPEYDQFARELAAYGIAVCMAKLATGVMFKDCHAFDRPCNPPPRDWTEQDRRGLVNETVAKALITFRKEGLIKERWRPDGNASLKTYFVGACILSFPNVYRNWLSERRRWQRIASVISRDRPTRTYGFDDPADIVTTRVGLEQALQDLDPRTREAIVLSECGYRQDEIAELMGVSNRSVEGLLYRHRAKTARQNGDEVR